MVTGEHPLAPQRTSSSQARGVDRDLDGGVWEVNTGRNCSVLILYLEENKLSLVGGHYGAPVVQKGRREWG